jgi:Uri superfamily endonuclease
MKGAYILLIYVKKKINISIGSLGPIQFKKGFYSYIGSAMGNTGSTTLLNRVKRHLSPPEKKKLHWHIDYLLQNENSLILKLYLIPSSQKLECLISQELSRISDDKIIDFGSSDCTCISHLLYFKSLKHSLFK